MEKRYTKKQIREAIAYWEKKLDEADQTALLNKVTPDVKRLLAEFGGLHNADKAVFLAKALASLSDTYGGYAKADPECGEFSEELFAAAVKVSEAAKKAAFGGFL